MREAGLQGQDTPACSMTRVQGMVRMYTQAEGALGVVSTTSQRVRYRCSRCKVRWSVKRSAKRLPRCPACGPVHGRPYSIEASRRRELQAQRRCTCLAYPFPHRAGSLRMCQQHVLADVPPMDDEIREYEACLMTPRSA